MHIGVSFQTKPNKNVLSPIFKNVDVEKFHWFNIESQNEVWANYHGGITFDENYYDGKSFLEQIHSEYFIIFLKLQAYLEKGGFVDIHTFKDFQSSDCQLLLLMYDCTFVDIYAKDQDIIKTIHENALANNYSEVQYINEENDSRTKMDVL